MIDLHLHTTASDGRLTPAQLVDRVSAAGLTTISVTDHDTVKSIDEVTALASSRGIRVVPGIEITAVDSGKDVHVLAYFIDHRNAALASFLDRQRGRRVGRVREIGARLAGLGMFIDTDAIVAPADANPGVSVGRPQLARALVAAGHVASIQEAFERWLANGQPAYVPRTGPSPAEVVRTIHDAGGIASMAHPGVTKRDELIAPLVADGLDAIEVYHSDHTPDDQQEYLGLAYRFSLSVSGGSDFHGDSPERERRGVLGVVSLPHEAFADLESRAKARRAS